MKCEFLPSPPLSGYWTTVAAMTAVAMFLGAGAIASHELHVFFC
jgi:hypothetical protein